MGGPARTPHEVAASLSRKLFVNKFNFYLVGYPGTCYNYSNQRRNMSEASEELKRIATALEEILRLVKEDQERSRKYMEDRKDD